MVNKTRRLTSRLLTLMAAGFFGFSSPAQANIGFDWLAAQAQPDGQFSTANDLATPLMATAETVRAFSSHGKTASSEPSLAMAAQFLIAKNTLNTEDYSRTLMAIKSANPNQSTTEFANLLLARVNDNGGLGDLSDYHSTVVDTAIALEALAMTTVIDTSMAQVYPIIDFLLKQQRTDGGWADNNNDTSIETTALVMHALWLYRHQVSHLPTLNLESSLDKAQAYLLAQRNPNGLWDETFETALALIAILPRLPTRERIQISREALQAAQLNNGSWDNDVYTTALALRALKMAQSPEPNPDLGQLTGVVIDGQTGAALSGVIVQLAGMTTDSQQTNSAGEFHFTGLAAGNYTIQIGEGTGLTAETVLKRGQQLRLGELRFFPDGATTLQGTVTDATSGEPLSGATLEITGIDDAIITDEQGTYLINNPPPGDAIIQARHSGYLTASNTVTITAGSSFIVPLALSPDQSHYKESSPTLKPDSV